jgi:hypothetical protein
MHISKARDLLLSACLLLAAVLSGCAGEQQQLKMESALTPYVGRSIADYVLDHGSPTSTLDLSSNKRAFQWLITGQSAGAVVPLGGMLVAVPPQPQTCLVSLVASASRPSPTLSDWTVESWRWNGRC